MKDLLLVGLRGNRPFRYTVDRALASPFHDRIVTLNVEDFIKEGSVEVAPDEEPVLRWAGEEIRLGHIRSCYNVLMSLPRQVVREGLVSEQDWHPYRSRLNALILALQRSRCLVINRPLLDGGNCSKPLHTFRLARCGFQVPRSLTTNSPEKALQFAEALSWRVIYKSSSARASVVSRLTPDRRADLEKIRSCPILLQEQISGPDVRVHVVGQQAFAERIDFDGGVDARHSPKAGRRFQAIELPDDIRALCVRFMLENGLWLAGFDFKLCTETGAYVALEANPTPGYDAYDRRLGGPISEALLHLMAEGYQRGAVS